MCAGFPRLGVLRRLRPVPGRSVVGAPSPAPPAGYGQQGKTRDSSRVHCGSLAGVGARLCPCGLAASTPQSFLAASLAACAYHLGSSPAHILSGCAPLPAQIHQVRAGAASRGGHTPVPLVLLSVPLAGPGPSGGTGPSRLCQGCSHPPRHHPDQAAPSFTALLRQDGGEGFPPPLKSTAPHGALNGTRKLTHLRHLGSPTQGQFHVPPTPWSCGHGRPCHGTPSSPSASSLRLFLSARPSRRPRPASLRTDHLSGEPHSGPAPTGSRVRDPRLQPATGSGPATTTGDGFGC